MTSTDNNDPKQLPEKSESGALTPLMQRATQIGAGAELGGVRITSLTELVDVATLMSQSGQGVPSHLRNNRGMCFAVCLSALEWKMSPFAVANKTYVTGDRLNYESQLVHAVIEARAPLRERLKCRYEGEGDDRICIVYGTFRGESEPREHRSPPLKQVRPPIGDKGVRKGSPLWDKKPDVQLFYDTSRDFCRIYCPDVLLGIYTPDEVEQYGIGNDAVDVSPGAALHERLKQAKAENGGAPVEGFRDGVVEEALVEGDLPAAVVVQPATTVSDVVETEAEAEAEAKPRKVRSSKRT